MKQEKKLTVVPHTHAEDLLKKRKDNEKCYHFINVDNIFMKGKGKVTDTTSSTKEYYYRMNYVKSENIKLIKYTCFNIYLFSLSDYVVPLCKMKLEH